MTRRHDSADDFANWFYKDDLSHVYFFLKELAFRALASTLPLKKLLTLYIVNTNILLTLVIELYRFVRLEKLKPAIIKR